MDRVDRLANTLDKTGIICVRAVNLGEGSGGKDDVGVGGRFRFEQFLDDDEFLARKTDGS